MRSAIVSRSLNAAELSAEVSGPEQGAVVLFLGTVRGESGGREVTGIEYQAYLGMAERELASIVAESVAAHPGADVVVEHRVGTLGVGEASVVIAVSHPHRNEAYAASRMVIEALKHRVPIWKREHYADGTREWVPAGTGSRTEEVVA